MKPLANLIFLVLFLYTVPMAITDWCMQELTFDQLQDPWLTTIRIVLWATWLSVEFMLLGIWELSLRQKNKSILID